MPQWLWILTVIPALGFLIFVHELGHFLTALRMGIKVEEFGFGYPPRMLTLFKWRGVPVTLNWLPLGGFVRMAGEEGNFEAEGSLAAASPWKKIPVMAAGAIMNVIAAIVIFALIAMFYGRPDPQGPVYIAEVQPNTPAANAGLRADDKVLEVDGQRIQTTEQLRQLVTARAGQNVVLGIQRIDDGNVNRAFNVTIVPRTPEQLKPNEGALGVALSPTYARLDPISSIGYGVSNSFYILGRMLVGLGTLLGSALGLSNQQVEGGVIGVVGIARQTGEIARTGGLVQYLNWTALISLNLALVNLLPIPALDGSRIMFALIEWVRRGKKVPPEKEAMVHAVGMIALLGLMLLITFSDVRNLLQGRDAFGG